MAKSNNTNSVTNLYTLHYTDPTDPKATGFLMDDEEVNYCDKAQSRWTLPRLLETMEYITTHVDQTGFFTVEVIRNEQ